MQEVLLGWRPDREEMDFEVYSQTCRGAIVTWSDIEEEIQRDAKNPERNGIDFIAHSLYVDGESEYEKYQAMIQQTNDCTSFGTMNACDLTQLFLAWRWAEHLCYRSHPAWIYGCGKGMNGQHADDGMSISLAMQWITQHGILPQGIPGLPAYSGALQKQLLRNPEPFFNQWKDSAVQYDIQCVSLPSNEEAWNLFIQSGRAIAYGTSTRIRKVNGLWQTNGRWSGHAMCYCPPFVNGRGTNINSHGDGWGGMDAAVLREIIRGTSSFGSAFGVYKIARKEVSPDYEMIGN